MRSSFAELHASNNEYLNAGDYVIVHLEITRAGQNQGRVSLNRPLHTFTQSKKQDSLVRAIYTDTAKIQKVLIPG